MIKLQVEEYCNDCKEFEACVSKLMYGYSGCLTTITCEHAEKCKVLAEYIKNKGEKSKDD